MSWLAVLRTPAVIESNATISPTPIATPAAVSAVRIGRRRRFFQINFPQVTRRILPLCLPSRNRAGPRSPRSSARIRPGPSASPWQEGAPSRTIRSREGVLTRVRTANGGRSNRHRHHRRGDRRRARERYRQRRGLRLLAAHDLLYPCLLYTS